VVEISAIAEKTLFFVRLSTGTNILKNQEKFLINENYYSSRTPVL
jgi:hypothetical protein